MDKLENTQLQERFARLFSGYTIAGQYARYVEMLTKAQEAQFFEKYEKLVNETKAQDSKAENEIFLSIIIRTQGKRADGLREALLCLEAQTDQDFEVILAAHKAKPHNLKQIKAILKEQTAAMRKKIRLIQIEEGTRAVPINYGFAYARGRYVSVYDDDDILFADYVEAFHQAAEFGEGKLLHAYVFSQKWKENVKSKNQTGYCAVGAPKPQYCQNFHLIRQLEKNLCPLMSIAFPRYLFDECRIMFDESLDVMEDWEYIMRTAPLCGVYDIEEVTSIYRHWMNAENSASIHGQDTWDKVYAQIRSRINGHPLLLPDGFLNINKKKAGQEQACCFSAGYPRMEGILFFDLGEGFSDAHYVSTGNTLLLPEFELKFSVPREYRHAARFRIDPCEYGGILLRDSKIILKYEDGTRKAFLASKCEHNGYYADGALYFMHYDPMLVWKNTYAVSEITIRGYVSMEIPEHLFKNAAAHEKRQQFARSSVWRRICGSIWRRIRRTVSKRS